MWANENGYRLDWDVFKGIAIDATRNTTNGNLGGEPGGKQLDCGDQRAQHEVHGGRSGYRPPRPPKR
jgi:hypothetical protein